MPRERRCTEWHASTARRLTQHDNGSGSRTHDGAIEWRDRPNCSQASNSSGPSFPAGCLRGAPPAHTAWGRLAGCLMQCPLRDAPRAALQRQSCQQVDQTRGDLCLYAMIERLQDVCTGFPLTAFRQHHPCSTRPPPPATAPPLVLRSSPLFAAAAAATAAAAVGRARGLHGGAPCPAATGRKLERCAGGRQGTACQHTLCSGCGQAAPGGKGLAPPGRLRRAAAGVGLAVGSCWVALCAPPRRPVSQ